MNVALHSAIAGHDARIDTLSSLLDQAPVPSFILDLSGTVLYANAPGSGLLGRASEGCLGLCLQEVVYEADRDEAYWLAEGLIEGSPSYSAEHRFVDKSGRCFWVTIALSLIRCDGGHAQYLWLQAIDIDTQKRAELALAESERRWNFALESAGQGVWEADLTQKSSGNRVYYSPTWRKMRGFGLNEVVDSSETAWLERVHPQDRERVGLHILQAGQLPRKVFEYRERHQDGHYIWIQSRGAPVEFDTNGRPTKLIGTDTDVTELKKIENRSKSLAQRLELALSVSKIGVFETDVETKQVLCDAYILKILGLPEDRLVISQDEFARTLHPDDAKELLAADAEAIANRSAFASTFRIIRPNGEVRTVASHTTYFEDEDGASKLIGTNWDITDDVALHESLLSANQLADVRYAELEIAKRKLERQALLDPLTGLPNRRYLEDVLDKLADEEGTAVSVLHMDLDRFKQINDNMGHIAGDLVLRHVAQLLERLATPARFVARVGGDEFVIVCPGQRDHDQLACFAEVLCVGLQQPFQCQGRPLRLGGSIGIAVHDEGRLDSGRLLLNADAALYRAKAEGRNRYEIFTSKLRREIEFAKRTADEVLTAVEERQFVPYYQPVVDAKTFNLAGVEALARWRHPVRGMLAPAAFLKSAEELKILAKIDAMILDQAVSDLKNWHVEGLSVPSVSVNVSFKRLKEADLVASLKNLSFAPGTLNFELLESIFLDDDDDGFCANIAGIRALGIGIDIDDFGTGHTSFLSLFRLNPRRFKIDRQLVAPIVESREKRTIVKSIIGIGKTLGIDVVAEGVETMEHADVLRRLGCDYLQGYAFGKPMPASELGAWCASRPTNSRDLR